MLALSWLVDVVATGFHGNTGAVIVFFLLLNVLYFYLKRRQLVNIPPGPKPWPVVGSLGGFLVPSFLQGRWVRCGGGGGGGSGGAPGGNVAAGLTELAKEYGNVFSLFVGSQLMVVLNGYDAVKDGLLNHPEVFSDRPDVPLISILTKRKVGAMLALSWLVDVVVTNFFGNIGAVIVFFFTFNVLYFYLKRWQLVNIPPGPKPLPLVGTFGGFLLPSFLREWLVGRRGAPGGNIAANLTEMAETYGNVFSLFAGSQLMVVLNGYEAVKDGLLNHPEEFSDRPDVPAISIMTKRKGIVFAPYGPIWRKQRKFCHSMLRTFGLGKLSCEPSILQGLATVKAELLRLNGETAGAGVDPAPLLRNSVTNVICSMVLGKRFDHDDAKFRALLDLMERGLEIAVNSPAVLINIFPFLYHMPFGAFKVLRQMEHDISVFLKAIIADHRETLDPENPRDVVDMYLMEILSQQAAGQVDSSFTDDYLFYIVGDLFIAGTDTTSNTVLWYLIYMILYPDIQEKVQAEIDAVVGQDRLPTFTDKANLPFTEATIMEVQRLTVVVPLGIPHMSSKTTEFRGFTIPKGAVILPNLWSVHRDPSLWDDPDAFNPSRFLNDDGTLPRKEFFIPFGIGRRVCMGEQLAKMEVFLMVTCLLQAFKFTLPKGKDPPSLQGRFGLTLAPRPFTVCLSARS